MAALVACNSTDAPKEKIDYTKFTKTELSNAKGFEILTKGDTKILRIYNKCNPAGPYQEFKLVKNKPKDCKDVNTIQVPCKKIICLSSTQLTYFFSLDDYDNIVATNSSRFLAHKGLKARVDSGLVKRVGKEGIFNIEMIAGLNPDLILVSPFKNGGFDAIKQLGIPLVPMAAYNEATPVARAEWVKMISPFVGKEQLADSLFTDIATKYNELKKLTTDVKHRPTIFSGKMRSGSWYVPGGKSFYAQYFKDAGAKYIIEDDVQGAYPLDFETMYAKAAKCDYWRLLVPEAIGYNRETMLEDDPRYGDFAAFKNSKVFMCNIRKIPYYEQNAMKPEIILADYIKIFHPELLPNHEPTFYHLLK